MVQGRIVDENARYRTYNEITIPMPMWVDLSAEGIYFYKRRKVI